MTLESRTNVFGGARNLVRQRDDPRQQPRRLQDGDARLAAERIPARELDHEVEALVDDQRKRMRRIETDRREQRLHLALEIIGDPGALRRIQSPRRSSRIPAFASAGSTSSLSTRYCSSTRLCASSPSAASSARRPGSVMPGGGSLREELLLQPGDADLEELVEIAADDAEEAQPLEHGDRRILREREHAPVERELRQLAIDRRRIGWTHRAVGR